MLRITITACLLVFVLGSVPQRCHNDEPCFPDTNDLLQFRKDLNGNVFFPTDNEYTSLVTLHNYLETKFPIVVAVVQTSEDVQKSVRFARKYNLRVSVMSSGHDYNGRSTAHESLMIHLGSMNKTNVNLSSRRNAAGEITCESGATWLQVYTEISQYDRVIVGGSAHTVSMGGYTLGGGHSPMCRMFGMAVDNLLEVEMVTADGDLIRADSSSTTFVEDDGTTRTTTDTDIFWALRGGGGGTYGIVTKFTHKLHHAAPGVVSFTCYYPIVLANGTNVGYDVLEKIGNLVPGLPREWGGYLTVNVYKDSRTGNNGSIGLFLNHYGTWDSPSRSYMDSIYTYKPELQYSCYYRNVSTFLDYEITAKDPPFYASRLFNILLHNNSFTKEFAYFVIDKVLHDHPIQESSVGFTGTLLGGQMHDVGTRATAVHPGWRTSLMSLAGFVAWNPANYVPWDRAEQEAKTLNDLEMKFGFGMYPNESGNNVTNWKDNFWGTNYPRLLQIKRKWDPDRFFYCSQCVGSDDSDRLKDPSRYIYLGTVGILGKK